MKQVLLCCGAGMSSGFLASSARKYAKKNKIDMDVEARSQSEVNEFASAIDLLMIAPHYAVELENFKKMLDPYGVPVVVIPNDIYTTLDGKRLVEFAQQTLKN